MNKVIGAKFNDEECKIIEEFMEAYNVNKSDALRELVKRGKITPETANKCAVSDTTHLIEKENNPTPPQDVKEPQPSGLTKEEIQQMLAEHQASIMAQLRAEQEVQEEVPELVLGELDNTVPIEQMGGLEQLVSKRTAKNLNAIYYYVTEKVQEIENPNDTDLYKAILETIKEYDNGDFDSANGMYRASLAQSNERFLTMIDRLTIDAINETANNGTIDENMLLDEIKERAETLFLESFKQDTAVQIAFNPETYETVQNWLSELNQANKTDIDLKTWILGELGKALEKYGKKRVFPTTSYHNETAYKYGLKLQGKTV